jgi:hypothetical protein
MESHFAENHRAFRPATPHESPRDSRFWSRSYQRAFMGGFARGEFDRFYKVWHRQAGKDDCDFNTVTQALVLQDGAGEIGNYGYIFPEFEHGKKALWDKVCAHNIRLIEHVPEAARAGKNWINEASMTLWLRNGTSLQVMGGRYPNKLRGMSLRGVIVSEFSRCNPGVLDVVSPMLENNGGWLIANTTPNGKNHAYDLWLNVEHDRTHRWFRELLTVDQTRRDARGEERFGEPVFGPRELAAERARGMTEEWIRQEYYCSWEAPMSGSIHGRLMEQVRLDGRVRQVPWQPLLPVHTWWDLGTTAVIFTQHTGREVLCIDYLYVGGLTFQEIVPQLFHGARSRYVYGTHNFPFDMNVTDYTAEDGRTRLDIAKALLGSERCRVGGNSKINDRIAAAQAILPLTYLDERKCAELVKALESYHWKYDEDRGIFMSKPEKDWASHGADAFGEMALHVKPDVFDSRPRKLAPPPAPKHWQGV